MSCKTAFDSVTIGTKLNMTILKESAHRINLRVSGSMHVSVNRAQLRSVELSNTKLHIKDYKSLPDPILKVFSSTNSIMG